MDKARRETLKAIAGKMRLLRDEIKTLRDEEKKYIDSLPYHYPIARRPTRQNT